MNRLLAVALLTCVAGCVRTVPVEKVRHLAYTDLRDGSLRYTGTDDGYDYYYYSERGLIFSDTSRYRIISQAVGDEFPRTSNRSRWVQVNWLHHTMGLPQPTTWSMVHLDVKSMEELRQQLRENQASSYRLTTPEP